MLNLVVNIVTTGFFRVNIGLNGGALLFAGGWTCLNSGEMCLTKVKILIWSSENMQCP